MLDRPRRLLGLAVLLLTVSPLLDLTGGTGPMAPAEALRHEGSRVQVAGVVVDVVFWSDGTGIARIAQEGRALDVRLPEGADPPRGAWLEAHGPLLRMGGSLRLLADGVRTAEPEGPLRPDWDGLADRPEQWTGRPLLVRGLVEKGRLHDDAGHSLALGDGVWPGSGAVEAVGVLAYDDRCLCHRLHAARVAPWTP